MNIVMTLSTGYFMPGYWIVRISGKETQRRKHKEGNTTKGNQGRKHNERKPGRKHYMDSKETKEGNTTKGNQEGNTTLDRKPEKEILCWMERKPKKETLH